MATYSLYQTAIGPYEWERPRASGFGFVAPAAVAAGSVAGAGGAAGAGAAAGAAVGGLATLGISIGVMAAFQGIQMWIQSARIRGQQKIGATTQANQAEKLLQRNLKAFQESGKTRADQQLALDGAMQIMDWLTGMDGCGNPQLGSAGQRCIEERDCHVAGEGKCRWPWLAYYVDPIKDDPDVVDVPVTATGGIDPVTGQPLSNGNGAGAGGVQGGVGIGSMDPLMLGAIGLVAVGVLMMSTGGFGK